MPTNCTTALGRAVLDSGKSTFDRIHNTKTLGDQSQTYRQAGTTWSMNLVG